MEPVKVVKNPFVEQDFCGQDKNLQESEFSLVQQDDSFINESRNHHATGNSQKGAHYPDQKSENSRRGGRRNSAQRRSNPGTPPKTPQPEPKHYHVKDGVRYIVVDQMSPKTKFVYDNFPDYDIDATSDGRRGGNMIAGVPITKSAHTVSCLPGMSLPAIPGPSLPAWLTQPNGHKIEEGEVIIDEFSAAIALKILI